MLINYMLSTAAPLRQKREERRGEVVDSGR